jgi:flagellar assembly protein FliH
MILRNVTVASERQVLGLQETPGLAAARPAPERRVPQLEVVSQQPHSAPGLNIAVVGEWLAAQPAETRAACAHILAAELTDLKIAAHAEGLELGRLQGATEVAAQASSGLAALAQIAAAGERAFALETVQLSEACADIVAEVFLKLAGPQLTAREAVLGTVLEVLARIKDDRELTIRVSSADLPLLQSHESGLRETLGARRWTLSADSRVSVGGCLVESAIGTLDGRLEVQLQGLCETIRAAKSARLEDV